MVRYKIGSGYIGGNSLLAVIIVIIVSADMVSAASMAFVTEKATFDKAGEKSIPERILVSDNSTWIQIIRSYDETNRSLMNDPFFVTSATGNVILQLHDEPLMSYSGLLKKDPGKKNKSDISSRIKAHKDHILAIHSSAKNDLKRNNIQVTYTGEYFNTFNGFAVEISKEDIPELRKMSFIKAIYPDKEVRTSLSESVPLINATYVWNMLDMNATNVTGKGVKVAIVDTGIDYTHPDLGGGFGPSFKVLSGWDFQNNDPDPMDDHGHGTHVAGIVAANGSLRGVAPDANLMAYKVLSSGGAGLTSNVIAGIEKAVDPDGDPMTDDGADIISMSLGGPGDPDDALSQAVDAAVDGGVVVVVAAGNSGSHSETINSPGTARKAITVGAVNKQDSIAGFSSRGPVVWSGGVIIKPEILAPGVSINSTVPGGPCSLCSPARYSTLDGTSMATPHISGAAALMLQLHPDWTPEQVMSVLTTTAKDLSYTVYTQGAGRIDASRAADAQALATPGMLSLGVVNTTQGIWRVYRNIELRNIGGTASTYNLMVQMPASSGVTASLSPNSVSLGPDQSTVINFSVMVDNSMALNGNYEGDIIVTSDSQTFKIPFAFLKKAVLKLKFSEEPFTLMIHDRNNVWKFLGYPGNSSTLLLDDGMYDIIVSFHQDAFVVRENAYISGSTELSINKTEAINRFEVIAFDENGNIFYPNEGVMSFLHKNSGMGQLSLGSFNRIKYFSNVSNAYSLDWEMISQSSKVNIINGYLRGGIYGNIAFINSKEDYRNLKVHFYPNVQSREILPIYNLCRLNPLSSLCFSIYSAGMEVRNSLQDAYIMPYPSPDFYFNSVQMDLMKGNFSNNELLYKSPYLHIKNNSVERSLFPLGSSLTALHLSAMNSTDIYFGLNPEHWSGKFDNLETTVRLEAYRGALIWLFLTQMYDFSSHENLPYVLYKDGIIVSNGKLNGAGNPWSSPLYVEIPLNTSGRYSLVIEKNYSINGTNTTAQVNATFDTSRTDKNPPSLTSMNLVSNGQLTDVIDTSKNNRLNFSVDPVSGSILSALLYYDPGTGWIQVSLTNSGSNYSARIPDTLTCEHCFFKILLTDNSLNSLEYQFEVPTGDTTAPHAVTNLSNNSYAWTYINWTWNDPEDPDFAEVLVYINGIYQNSISRDVQYHNATGLSPGMQYTISTRSVDTRGNINQTWVNQTAKTRSMDPRTLVVDTNGSANYTSIREAINNSNNGDTIIVHSGTYHENLNVTKQVILTGQDTGSGQPVVDGMHTKSTIILSSDGIWIEGFRVINSSSWPEAAIKITSHNNTVTGNILSNKGQSIDNGSGIYLLWSNYNNISGNDFTDNYMGIYLERSRNNNITGNSVRRNNNGIHLGNSIFNTIRNNDVNRNNNNGIYLEVSSNNTISGNNASSNANNGIVLYRSAIIIFSMQEKEKQITVASNDPDSAYNTVTGNLAMYNNHGIYLYDSVFNNITNNNASKNNYSGIFLQNSSNNNTLHTNTISSNTDCGIIMDSSRYNNIYNNLFNNTVNYRITGSSNNWNTSRKLAGNIIGGSYLGGNVYLDSNGTGFSQTCSDLDFDGICDAMYSLDAGNPDYLPLAQPGFIEGTILENGIGITGATVSANMSLKVTANASGFYSLPVPAGTYILTAAKEPEYYSNSSITVSVSSGKTIVQDIELMKKPTGTIMGSVADAAN